MKHVFGFCKFAYIAIILVTSVLTCTATAQDITFVDIHYPTCTLKVRSSLGITILGTNATHVTVDGAQPWVPSLGCMNMFAQSIPRPAQLPLSTTSASSNNEVQSVSSNADIRSLQRYTEIKGNLLGILQDLKKAQRTTGRKSKLINTDTSTKMPSNNTIQKVMHVYHTIERQINAVPIVSDYPYLEENQGLKEKIHEIIKENQGLDKRAAKLEKENESTHEMLVTSMFREATLSIWVKNIIIGLITFVLSIATALIMSMIMNKMTSRQRVNIASLPDDRRWLRELIIDNTWLSNKIRILPYFIVCICALSSIVVLAKVATSDASLLTQFQDGSLIAVLAGIITAAIAASRLQRDMESRVLEAMKLENSLTK